MVKLDPHPLIFKECKIIPFENLDGVITAINYSKKGIEIQVRYFLNGEYKIEWFFDFDIDIKYSEVDYEEAEC